VIKEWMRMTRGGAIAPPLRLDKRLWRGEAPPARFSAIPTTF
jgi:hypothetical protein